MLITGAGSAPAPVPTQSPADSSSPDTAPTQSPGGSPTASPTQSAGGPDNSADGPTQSGDSGDDSSQGGDPTPPPNSNGGGGDEDSDDESVEVPTDTFEVFYTLSEPRLPTSEEYEQLARLTSNYLEDYMRDEFGSDLEIFSTFMIFQSFQTGQPARSDYRSIGTFKKTAASIPTTEELNSLITSAFTDPDLQDYLARFNTLPAENVFKATNGVTVRSAAAQAGSESSSGGAAAAAAIASLAVVGGVVYVARKRKNKANDEVDADNADKLNGEGSVAGTIGVSEGDDSMTVESQ